MSKKILHPSMTGRGATSVEPAPGRARPGRLGIDAVDWRAARRSDRACCCPAGPAVIAIMPPVPGRPHPTDLLLCGHHYRAYREALAAAGATLLDLDGLPVAGDAWPRVRPGR